MKKMRKLIPAFSMLLVAAIMLSTASYAWFTMGTTAEATGMQVKAEAASSLLIVDAEGVTSGKEYEAFKGATNTIAMESHTKTLIPATAFTAGDLGENVAAPASNLVTLADYAKVNSVTGATTDGASFVAAEDNKHFVEYVMYIASAAGDMGSAESGNTLCATISLPQATVAKYIDNALSIQINVYDNKSDDVAASKTVTLKDVAAASNQKLVVDLKTAVIPGAFEADANGAYTAIGDYVKVVMRVYYDGAMEDTAKQMTYLRNDTMINLDTATAFGLAFDYGTAGDGSVAVGQ